MVSSFDPQRFILLFTKLPELLTMGEIHYFIFCSLPLSIRVSPRALTRIPLTKLVSYEVKIFGEENGVLEFYGCNTSHTCLGIKPLGVSSLSRMRLTNQYEAAGLLAILTLSCKFIDPKIFWNCIYYMPHYRTTFIKVCIWKTQINRFSYYHVNL